MASSKRTDAAVQGCALALALAFQGPSLGAEPTSELAGGGLSYSVQQALVTESEDIVLATDKVQTTYIVRNQASEPFTTLVAFALPDIDMLALDGSPIENAAFDPQNASNFVAFRALVDGKPVDTFVDAHALALGTVDVTAKVREAKLPLYPLQPGMNDLIAALPPPVRDDLAAHSLIRFLEGQWEPQWRLKTTLFWRQEFEPGQVHTIAIAYRPIAGTSIWTAEISQLMRQRYCVPAAAADALDKRPGEGAPLRWVHYQAFAGLPGRGPSSRYRIAIDNGQSPGRDSRPSARAAYTCNTALSESAMAGASGSREKTLSDHTPDDEVQVLFVD